METGRDADYAGCCRVSSSDPDPIKPASSSPETPASWLHPLSETIFHLVMHTNHEEAMLSFKHGAGWLFVSKRSPEGRIMKPQEPHQVFRFKPLQSILSVCDFHQILWSVLSDKWDKILFQLSAIREKQMWLNSFSLKLGGLSVQPLSPGRQPKISMRGLQSTLLIDNKVLFNSI